MTDTLDILVILDRSGSMEAGKNDHEGGLKSFINDQRALPGDVRFTFVQFDSTNPCEILYDQTPIADVKDIVLTPRGGTPLYDAIGAATTHLIVKNPVAVVCLIITDGEENSSREWDKARVATRIADLEKKGWDFLFLGANLEAMDEHEKVGINVMQAMQFDQHDPKAAYAAYTATSANVGNMRGRAAMKGGYRSLNQIDKVETLSYSEAQRDEAAGGSTSDTVTTTTTTNEEGNN